MKRYRTDFSKILLGAGLIVGSFLVHSCTDNFEDINRKDYTLTDEDLEKDNFNIGGFFPTLEQQVYSTLPNTPNPFQLQQNLVGDLYSGYMTAIKNYGDANNGQYLFKNSWLDNPYKLAYSQTIGAWYSIKKKTQIESDKPHMFALAEIIKVASLHRFTDMWGPMPYTQLGTGSLAVPYDSQEVVYKSMIADLDNAITELTEFNAAYPGARPLAKFDMVYEGDYAAWVRFANSLKLRLAVRMAYADPSTAQQKAEEAINHPLGTIIDVRQNAAIKSTNGIMIKNPLEMIWSQYGDIRMGGSIQSIMTGYNDPRLPEYFQEVTIGSNTGYFGLREGATPDQTKYKPFSSPNVYQDDPMVWMSAAEVAFLKAEGALRGWSMGADVKSLYEQGVRFSFEQYGLSGADAYLADASSMPAEYVNVIDQKGNAAATSTITIAWDDAANFETKLERIITQKWIALFPDGQEAWTEQRRTGYPKLFKPQYIQNPGFQSSGEESIRRYPYPPTEITTNYENYNAALSLLGGPDNCYIKLWWDQKN